MTTVCFKDGIMSADTRAYSGDKHPIGNKNKLYRLANGTLVGCSSSAVGEPARFARWLSMFGDDLDCATVESDEPHGVQALVVQPDGSVFYWQDGTSFTGPLEADFYAIGSGEQYAYGAMMMGASAQEAVEVAIAVDQWTGGTATIMRLKEENELD